MNIFLVKSKLNKRKELAIMIHVKKEKGLFEDNSIIKMFYLLNQNIFVPEDKMFSYIESYSTLKGFDIDMVCDIENTYESIFKLKETLLEVYLLNQIIQNAYMFDMDKIFNKNIEIYNENKKEKIVKIKDLLKNIIPKYYFRYNPIMYEEFKSISEWEKFYNVKINNLDSFEENNHHYEKLTKENKLFCRLDFIKKINKSTDFITSDRLEYDLKTYLNEPKDIYSEE